jgi:hypothetical protein
MLQLPSNPVSGDLAITWVLDVAEAQGGAKESAAHHERVVRADGIASLCGVVVKKIGIQPSASEEFPSDVERNGFCLDVSCGEIDVSDFSV